MYNKWKTYVKSSKQTLSSVFMMSYAKFQLQSKKYVEEWICVRSFPTSLYLEPQVDCKEGLHKKKRKTGQKQALSSFKYIK